MKRLLPAATFVASRLADTSLPEIIARLIRLPPVYVARHEIDRARFRYFQYFMGRTNLSKILIEGRVASPLNHEYVIFLDS